MKKELRRDQCPWERAVKEERLLNPRKSPHQQGDQPGQKGFQSLRVEHRNQFITARTETDLHRWITAIALCSQAETQYGPRPSNRPRGRAGGGGWRGVQGRRLGRAVKKQPEGKRIWATESEGSTQETQVASEAKHTVWRCARREVGPKITALFPASALRWQDTTYVVVSCLMTSRATFPIPTGPQEWS